MEPRLNRGRGHDLRQAGRWWGLGDSPALFRVGADQSGDIVSIGSGDHDVSDQWREMRDELRTQRPDMDPGPRRQLEVFRGAAFEQQALRYVGEVYKAERVAKPVEAFVVERRGGEVGSPPVAGRNAWTAHATVELAVVGNELHLDANRGQPDVGGDVRMPGAGQRIGR